MHLIGYAGVGKLTVAKDLIRQASMDPDRRMVLVDNHLTGNPILSLLQLDGHGQAPPETWPFVFEIRQIVHRAIPVLTPPTWSFVFTNVIRVDEPLGHAAIDDLHSLAATRGSTYVPVVLTCEREENLRRAAAAGRAENHKWVDVEAIAARRDTTEILVPDDPTLLCLDVTNRSPAEAAGAIRAHLQQLQVGPTASS